MEFFAFFSDHDDNTGGEGSEKMTSKNSSATSEENRQILASKSANNEDGNKIKEDSGYQSHKGIDGNYSTLEITGSLIQIVFKYTLFE